MCDEAYFSLRVVLVCRPAQKLHTETLGVFDLPVSSINLGLSHLLH